MTAYDYAFISSLGLSFLVCIGAVLTYVWRFQSAFHPRFSPQGSALLAIGALGLATIAAFLAGVVLALVLIGILRVTGIFGPPFLTEEGSHLAKQVFSFYVPSFFIAGLLLLVANYLRLRIKSAAAAGRRG